MSARPRRLFQLVERVDTTRENGVENRMVNDVKRTTRHMKAIRMGLIVGSWAFLVLGFMLTHNV